MSQETALSPVVRFALRKYIGEDTLVPCKGSLREKDRCIVAGLLRYLMANQETFMWDGLRAWALTVVGSSTEFADEIGALGDEVLAGDSDESDWWKFQSDAIEHWRAAAPDAIAAAVDEASAELVAEPAADAVLTRRGPVPPSAKIAPRFRGN